MQTEKIHQKLNKIMPEIRDNLVPFVSRQIKGKIETYEYINMKIMLNMLGDYAVTCEAEPESDQVVKLKKRIADLQKANHLDKSNFNSQIAKLEKQAKKPPEYTEQLVETLTGELRESTRQLRDARNELRRVYLIIQNM